MLNFNRMRHERTRWSFSKVMTEEKYAAIHRFVVEEGIPNRKTRQKLVGRIRKRLI